MRTRSAAALALAILPSFALANGYDVPNVNPRDLAMAGSVVAAQVDAAATYQNPAALPRLDGLNLSLSGSILDLATDWKAPAGSTTIAPGTAHTKDRPAPPVSLFASYGFALGERRAGVGFGMNVPGGGNVFWQDDWQGRGRIITVDRKLYGFYLNGAYELLPRVRVAAGLNYLFTTEYLKLGLQPSTSSYGEVGTKGGGLGFQLATEVTPLDGVPLTLGVDYKHKVRMDLRGDGNFVVPDAFLQPTGSAPAPVDQDVRHVLTFPNILHAGLAYRPLAPLLVTFDYTFNRYVVYRADVFEGSRGTTIDVPRDYGNGYTFRLGAEVDARPRLKLRAGVLRDLSGYRRDTFSPTLPDSAIYDRVPPANTLSAEKSRPCVVSMIEIQPEVWPGV